MVEAFPALPIQPGRFIGRSVERESLLEDVRSRRMITIVGPGGGGKTRLALEVAAEARAAYGIQPAFVDLSAVRTDAAVLTEAARQLGTRGAPDQKLVEALATRLLGGPVLLILDNCEQVLGGARELLTTLLESCRELKVVATSRERLHIAGEHAQQLAPLGVPARSAEPHDIAKSDSVQLFVDRARTGGRDFELTDANSSAVSTICRRLDGLPLAIELLAAWAPVLGLTGSRKGLWSRLDLEGESRAGRHRSLRAVMDWSAGLLGENERRLWTRLAIFEPPFDLDAIEAICDDVAVPSALRSLIDHSLVEVLIGQYGVARYRLLETVREYVREALVASGELDSVAGAHAHYYVDQAEQAFGHRDEPGLIDWATAMTVRHTNVRAALDHLRVHDREAELQLAGAMGWVWGARELLPEGRRLLELALEGSTSTTRSAARAHRAAGFLALEQGDDSAAHTHIRRAFELSAAQHDEASQAICLSRLGAFPSAGYPERRELLERAIELAQKTRERAALIVALANLGELELQQGHTAVARRRFEEAVTESRAVGHARWMPDVLDGLAQACLAAGDAAGSEGAIKEAISLAERASLLALLPSFLETLSEVAVAADRPERALRLAGSASGLRQSVPGSLPCRWPARLAAAVARARRASPGRARALLEEGARMTREEAVAFALAGAPDAGPGVAISRRQAQAAVLVAAGLTNAQIAVRLGVSERTAEWHIEELRNRLGFTSRAQVAAWAVREGLSDVKTKA